MSNSGNPFLVVLEQTNKNATASSVEIPIHFAILSLSIGVLIDNTIHYRGTTSKHFLLGEKSCCT